jgi:hypothetical protein
LDLKSWFEAVEFYYVWPVLSSGTYQNDLVGLVFQIYLNKLHKVFSCKFKGKNPEDKVSEE